ncbi:hypothetical protein C8R47DRAFT_1082771 [Mycena vitilis]|nr:hypothetical protein C8R47DRAFT_1082771 [Mycena vitilis]
MLSPLATELIEEIGLRVNSKANQRHLRAVCKETQVINSSFRILLLSGSCVGDTGRSQHTRSLTILPGPFRAYDEEPNPDKRLDISDATMKDLLSVAFRTHKEVRALSCSVSRIWSSASIMPISKDQTMQSCLSLSLYQSKHEQVLLLQTVPTLPVHESLNISAANSERNRDAKCGNPARSHRTAVQRAVVAVVQEFRGDRASQAEVWVGLNGFRPVKPGHEPPPDVQQGSGWVYHPMRKRLLFM